jgi:hypothetical protein
VKAAVLQPCCQCAHAHSPEGMHNGTLLLSTTSRQPCRTADNMWFPMQPTLSQCAGRVQLCLALPLCCSYQHLLSAVQGTDVKLSGHFVYASVSDMSEYPPLRCTNRCAGAA